MEEATESARRPDKTPAAVEMECIRKPGWGLVAEEETGHLRGLGSCLDGWEKLLSEGVLVPFFICGCVLHGKIVS